MKQEGGLADDDVAVGSGCGSREQSKLDDEDELIDEEEEAVPLDLAAAASHETLPTSTTLALEQLRAAEARARLQHLHNTAAVSTAAMFDSGAASAAAVARLHGLYAASVVAAPPPQQCSESDDIDVTS